MRHVACTAQPIVLARVDKHSMPSFGAHVPKALVDQLTSLAFEEIVGREVVCVNKQEDGVRLEERIVHHMLVKPLVQERPINTPHLITMSSSLGTVALFAFKCFAGNT